MFGFTLVFAMYFHLKGTIFFLFRLFLQFLKIEIVKYLCFGQQHLKTAVLSPCCRTPMQSLQTIACLWVITTQQTPGL